MAQLVKNVSTMRGTWVQSLGWEDPWRRERLPTPVFWTGEFHGLYSPLGLKESDTTGVKHSASFGLPLDFPYGSAGKESACNAGDLGSIPGLEDPLKKGTTTHSSILDWRIPWAILSMG